MMKISQFNQRNSAFYPYYDRTLLLFSRPIRDKDTSDLREMFQYSSLAEKSFNQWEIATHWRAFQIQDKSRHGLIKMTGDNSWCPCRSNTCGQWWDHLYKSSEPIGLQSLSAEPWRARNGVLKLAVNAWRLAVAVGTQVIGATFLLLLLSVPPVEGCYKADLTSPSLSMLSPMATTKA